MTRTRLSIPSLPLFLLAAAVVAILAFGITRWLADPSGSALPPLQVRGDTAAAAPGALNLSTLYTQRVDTTVTIEATIDGQPMDGAGVVVSTDGTIITASHVVKDYDKALAATQVLVRFKKGDEVLATVKAIDQFNDLAILQVDPAQVQGGIVAAPLGDSDQVLVGAEVAAIGAPYGNTWSITDGHVSATHRVVGSRINALSQIPDMLQFDAAINPGNSGGPVFNARGEVIGISQQIASESKTSSGIAFAVSSNLVTRALKVYRATGSIQYAELGLEVATVTPQLAAAAQLTASRGALVQNAIGPASQAGLSVGREITQYGRNVKLGDQIVELAGLPVTSSDDVLRITSLLDPTAAVTVVYLRAGERREATIRPVVRQVV